MSTGAGGITAPGGPPPAPAGLQPTTHPGTHRLPDAWQLGAPREAATIRELIVALAQVEYEQRHRPDAGRAAELSRQEHAILTALRERNLPLRPEDRQAARTANEQ